MSSDDLDTDTDVNEIQKKNLAISVKKLEKKSGLPCTKSMEMLSISSDTIFKVGQSLNSLEKSSEKSFAQVLNLKVKNIR